MMESNEASSLMLKTTSYVKIVKCRTMNRLVCFTMPTHASTSLAAHLWYSNRGSILPSVRPYAQCPHSSEVHSPQEHHSNDECPTSSLRPYRHAPSIFRGLSLRDSIPLGLWRLHYNYSNNQHTEHRLSFGTLLICTSQEHPHHLRHESPIRQSTLRMERIELL